MFEVDKKILFSAMLAPVALVIVAGVVRSFLPASVPGSAVIKDTLDKAAS